MERDPPPTSASPRSQHPILVIDEDRERAEMLSASLRQGGYTNVIIYLETGNLIDLVSSLRPSMVLIDVESPSRDTLEQLTLIRDQAPRPVILFSQDRDVATIEAAIASGVSAYVTDGIDHAHVLPAISIARATFGRIQSLRTELTSTRVDLSERKLVERAKGILMRSENLTEDQAYKSLRRMATDQRRPMVDIADGIILQSLA